MLGLPKRLKKIFSFATKKDEDDSERFYEEMEVPRRNDDYDYVDFSREKNYFNTLSVSRFQHCQLMLHDEVVQATFVEEKGEIRIIEDENLIRGNLRNSSLRKVSIRGQLNNKICTIVSEISRCDAVHIEEAKITCTAFWMAKLLNPTTSLIMVDCTFEDAQTIRDEVFVENPQLVEIHIDGSLGSNFPLLTDRLLRFWTQQRRDYKIRLSAETSFSFEGIQYIIQMFHGKCRSSIYLGRLVCAPRELILPSELEITIVGFRYFLINKEHDSTLLSFDRSTSTARRT